ncbi:Uncharacterised protein [uncultured archaeon]|nr:Uncharacterised protein [uncultured archaeon]
MGLHSGSLQEPCMSDSNCRFRPIRTCQIGNKADLSNRMAQTYCCSLEAAAYMVGWGIAPMFLLLREILSGLTPETELRRLMLQQSGVEGDFYWSNMGVSLPHPLECFT